MSPCPRCNLLTPEIELHVGGLCDGCQSDIANDVHCYHADKPGELCRCRKCVCCLYTEDEVCEDCRNGRHQN